LLAPSDRVRVKKALGAGIPAFGLAAAGCGTPTSFFQPPSPWYHAEIGVRSQVGHLIAVPAAFHYALSAMRGSKNPEPNSSDNIEGHRLGR